MPESHKRQATALEKEARVHQVLRWIDENIRGKRLADLIMEEFKVGHAQAYNYIRFAQELEESLIAMAIPDLKKYVRANYQRLSRAKDKKIALQATDRLAKHAAFFPTEKLEVTSRYDEMCLEQLEKLNQDENLT